MPTPIFRVSAVHRPLLHCPLSVRLPRGSTVPRGAVEMVDEAGQTAPAQIERADGGAILRWVVPRLEQGQQRGYRLRAAVQHQGPGVRLETQGEQVTVSIDGAFFTAYHFGARWSKPFLHPLLGPTGPVTRRFPMEEVEGETRDHPHHTGCWTAWGDVNGVDLWSEEPGHGRIVHQKVGALVSGPVTGGLVAVHRWQGPDGRPLLDEQRVYRFYHTPAEARTLDLTVRLTASYDPVRLGDTKEGGLCSVRVASSMDAAGQGRFANGYGAVNEAEAWGRRAPWCDYCGPVAGSVVGICIMDHPDNFRHPTWWHVRDDGLMTANPFGLSHFHPQPGSRPDGSITLPRGRSLVFRYRLLIHRGDTKAANVARAYHDYVSPPAVEVA